MKFETELINGRFVVSECQKCKKIVWPSSDICNYCLGITNWRDGDKNGKIIEFSKHEDDYFCLAEFENAIRIMGKIISGIPKVEGSVEIKTCGIKNGNHFYELSLN